MIAGLVYSHYRAKNIVEGLVRDGMFSVDHNVIRGKKKLDAVVMETSPFPPSMETERVEAAVNMIEGMYGRIKDYDGLWIPAGVDNKPGEVQQRKIIYDLLVKKYNIDDRQIVEVKGRNTSANIEELIPLISEYDIHNLGVSSFPSHLERYAFIFNKFRRQLPKDFFIAGVTTPYINGKVNRAIKRGFGIVDWVALAKTLDRIEGR